MKNNNNYSQSIDRFPPYLEKCEYCKSKDGKEKDIYENFQLALDTAEYIEKERRISLNVYQCPHGKGWHLTKNNASSEIYQRKENFYQNDDIPLRSPNGSWEYIRDEEFKNNYDYNKINEVIKKKKYTNKKDRL